MAVNEKVVFPLLQHLRPRQGDRYSSVKHVTVRWVEDTMGVSGEEISPSSGMYLRKFPQQVRFHWELKLASCE